MTDALAQLGLPAEEVIQAARLSSPLENFRLLSALDRLQGTASPGLTEAKRLPSKLQLIKKRYQDDLTSLLADLQQGEIDRREFAKQAKPIISGAFQDAYAAGVRRPLDDGDREWLRRAVDSEVGHAAGLARDVDEGNVKDVTFRAGNYAAGLDGVAWSAMVEELPDDSVIHWKLGCLTSNSFTIITANGKMPLEQVKVGDLVLTHAGRWRRVLAKPVTRSAAHHRYAVLVANGGKLVGLTDDHRLWTDRGWLMAREVAGGKGKVCGVAEGRVPRVREGSGQAEHEVPGVLRGVPDEEAGGGPDAGELRPAFEGREVLHGCLEREEVRSGAQSPMGLGAGERGAAVGEDDPPRERRPVGRQAGEPLGGDEGRAQPSPFQGQVRGGCAGLEGREDPGDLRALRDELRGIRSLGGQAEVLLDGVQRGGRICCQGECAGVRAVREGVRPDDREDRPGQAEREPEKFLLSRLLAGDETEGRDADPVLRLLREDLRALAVEDREVAVGDVVLLASVLEQDACLYDLTVDEDHSFVVEGMPLHNSAEHCDDCVILASHSPYDKWSLPTTPKAGDSACRSNCKCRLVFEAGGEVKTGVFSIPGQLDDSLPSPSQGQSLADWLRPPKPPEGLSLPEGADRLAVDSITAELNYWRRVMAQLDEVEEVEEFMAAAAARKDANARLITYLEERDLWDAPALSVDEVVSGRDLPLRAEREIFEMGVSGEQLTESEARAVQQLVDRYERAVGKKWSK